MWQAGALCLKTPIETFPCAPARYSLLTGQLASRIDGYGNATEFAADTPTLPYHLSALCHHTSLAGTMHLVGPDQMYGYRERLATDIYPGDFGWTPNWPTIPPHGPAGMSMRSVVVAGLCTLSLQFDYDDEVANKMVQRINGLARHPGSYQQLFFDGPFTHPHNPYEGRIRCQHTKIAMTVVAPRTHCDQSAPAA